MAQKRRGLGRGLEALIPDAQKEKVSASRPSDVFFPSSREAETQNDGATPHSDRAPDAESAATEVRSTRDLTATLLAPSQRKRASKSRSTSSSRTPAKSKQTTSVSRETTSDSAESADDAKKKTQRAVSTMASKKRAQSAGGRTAPKHPSKGSAETTPATTSVESDAAGKVEEQSSRPETVEVPNAAEEATHDSATAVDNAVVDTVSEGVEKPEESAVSRETEEEHSVSEKAEPSQFAAAQPSGASNEPEDHAEAHGDGDGGDAAAETDGPDLVPVPGAHFAEIPVGLIHPNPRQPRQVFDEEDISELAASIAEVGLLQPIVVRQVSTAPGEEPRYELIMGERRLRASKEAGLETIPAVVRDTDDVDLLRDALLENLHRVQLNPLEEAAAYQQLLEDFQCTHAELSERIARSRSQISNTLRLMKLPPLVQRRLAANVISAGHARALLGLPNAAEMERLAQRVVAEGLSVRATEELVALHEDPEPGSDQPRVLRARSTPLPALSTRLSDAFDTRVKVTRGAKKGRITIEFAGDEDLARIVGALAPGTSLDED